MSEKTSNQTRHSDVIGLVLFSLGAFFAVLSVMALTKGVPEEGVGGTMVLAKGLVDAIGAVPGLVLAAGLATLGALLFLSFPLTDPLRHGAGVVGVALGVAVLMGAVQAGAGGGLGATTGGALAASLHPVAGFVAGLFAIAVPVWLAWGRNFAWRFERPERPAESTEAEQDGVTAEEAAALIPARVLAKALAQEPEPRSPLPQPKSAESRAKKAAEADAPLTSPYPEDVRLKGEVPSGTRPLESETDDTPEGEDAGAEVEAEAVASSVQRWTPKDGVDRSDSADEDLAQDEPAEEPRERKLVIRGLGTSPDVQPLGPSTPKAAPPAMTEPKYAPGVRPIGNDGRPIEAGGQVVQRTTDHELSIPRPSWEQPDEEEVEQASLADVAQAEEEPAPAPAAELPEPVDAYGTPLSVREAQDTASEDLSVVAERTPEELEEPEAVLEDEEEVESEDGEEYAEEDPEAAELEDEEEDGEEYEYEDEAEDGEEDAAEAAELEDEEEDDEEYEYEDEAEDGEEDAEEAAELEDEEEGDEEYEYEDGEEEEYEEDPAEAAELEDEEEEGEEYEYEDEDGEEEDAEAAELEDEEEDGEYEDEDAEEDDEAAELEDAEDDLDDEEEFADAAAAELEDDVEDYELEEEDLARAATVAELSAASSEEAPSAVSDEESADRDSGEADEPREAAAEVVAEEEEAVAAEAEAEAEPEEPAVAEAEQDEPEPAVAEAEQAEQAEQEPAVAEAAEEDEEPAVAEEDEEPVQAEADVVLTPQPPPAVEAASEPVPTSESDLIFEAGCLFLEENRVAVSMLQRKFRLDFDKACGILDQLQELGLIGPYLGGQQRDILLSRDEWMEKVTSP